MLSADNLTGVYVKIERAKKHVADLRSACNPFVDVGPKTRPYRLYAEIDPETREQIIRVAIYDALPLELGAMAGDAVHNLRSALDLLMWQLVIGNGGTPTDKTMFPISETPHDFVAAPPRAIQGASGDVASLLQTLKPHMGGNDALWRIHRIDIVDKHHVLIPAAMLVEAVFSKSHSRVDGVGRRRYPNLLANNGPIFPLKDEAEIVRLPPSTNVNVEPEGICEIAFAEPEVVEGQAMVPTLAQLADYVEGVVRAFAILP